MEWPRRLWEAAKKFIPHEFSTKVELTGGLPRVLVSREAYEDMHVIVEEASQEIGFLGTVRKVGRDFLIEEIFLFEQQVHSTTCEITPDGLANMAQELVTSRPDGMDVCNRLCFWGHSHVNMGTSPSGQDDVQLNELAGNANDGFFIRAILNKNGRMEFTIVLTALGLVIRDAAWELHEPAASEARRERWRREISAKVRSFPVPNFPEPFGSQVAFSSGPNYGFRSTKKGGRHGRGEG